MAEETTISMAGINAPPLYRLVEDGGKTVIVTADTNTPMWVINGDIAGGAKPMTTAERTAITPSEGELIFDTDLGAVYVGDGVTPGGVAISGGGGGGAAPDAGYRINYTSAGSTINFNPIQPIVNVTGNSVTLAPDTAYKMYATTGALNVTANPPAANYWGLEGHAEIFVGSVGYVVFDTSKIVLANQLEPDSVNNCTLRFHDGMCYISVEDHIAGYIVVNGSTSGDGSLYYGISTSTNDYVAFDASLNGTPIPLAGAVAEGEKHVVGNGYTETTLTGAVNCGTSKFTVANLSLQDVGITDGTMTLGDAYIPSGSTVSLGTAGGLVIERVTGDGTGVIDLGNHQAFAPKGDATANQITLRNGSAGYGGGAIQIASATFNASNCTVANCSAGSMGGGAYMTGSKSYANFADCNFSGCTAILGGAAYVIINSMTFTDCSFSGNSATGNNGGNAIYVGSNGNAILNGCTFDTKQTVYMQGAPGGVTLTGKNTFSSTSSFIHGFGPITISSGAIIDLTGNDGTSPIRTGNTITFGASVTVITSAGTTVSLNGGVAGTCQRINNDGTTN